MCEEQLAKHLDEKVDVFTKTVMLFDDRDSRKLASKIETEQPKIMVIPYSKVGYAIEELEQGLKADVLITDLGVENNNYISSLFRRNGQTGEELALEAIKRQIPVITMSDMDYKPHFSMYHMQKPIKSKDLVNAIESILKYK